MLFRGGAGGLKHSGENGCVIARQLAELLLIVVIENDVNAQDPLHEIHRLSVETRNCAIVDGEDGDGCAAVNFVGEFCLRQEIVEIGEIGELAEEFCDIESRSRGEEEKIYKKGSGNGSGIHCFFSIIDSTLISHSMRSNPNPKPNLMIYDGDEGFK